MSNVQSIRLCGILAHACIKQVCDSIAFIKSTINADMATRDFLREVDRRVIEIENLSERWRDAFTD